MTEAERYEGKSAKKSQKRNPQQEWMDIVTTSVKNAPGHLTSYLQIMAGLDNIPRKEKQFRNFTANSLNLRGRNEAVVGEIWNLLKNEREKRQAEKEKQQQQQSKNEKEENNELGKGVANTEDELLEKTQPNEQSKGNESTGDVSSKIDPKVVQKAMKKALKKAPNQSMKTKELRKLLGVKLGVPKSAEKRLKQLLKDAPAMSKKNKIRVDGKMVTLI